MNRSILRVAAFSLVEVTLALGVSGFCLVAIFGLLPMGLKSSQTAMEQTVANGLLSMVAADLRGTPLTSPPGLATSSQQFAIPIPANPVATAPGVTTLYFSEEGTCATTRQAASRYQLSVSILQNIPSGLASGQATRIATMVKLQVSWPAGAAPTEAAGSVQAFFALDRN